MFKTADQGGCDAPLQLVVRALPSPGSSHAPGSGGGGGAKSGSDSADDVIEFWGCSRWPGCEFRDVLPRRLAQPRLCLEAAGTAGFLVGSWLMPFPCGILSVSPDDLPNHQER